MEKLFRSQSKESDDNNHDSNSDDNYNNTNPTNDNTNTTTDNNKRWMNHLWFPNLLHIISEK